ncbi:MAG: hypothetical protein K2W82_16080 [Candidatus Obscuribacterales bacterium]|nr:hypothetical protein [Candidatus Obscuribacterales bacterium]
MNTLVIADSPAGFLRLLLSDLAAVPSKGRSYVFDGTLYEVTSVVEYFGSRTALGKELSGNEKLLKLLKTVLAVDDAHAGALISGIKDVGSYALNSEKKSGGGIITASLQLVDDYEHVIFVRLKQAQTLKSDHSVVAAPIRLFSEDDGDRPPMDDADFDASAGKTATG